MRIELRMKIQGHRRRRARRKRARGRSRGRSPATSGCPHGYRLLYRAAALNLLHMGGDPESEFAAVRACDMAQIDFGDPELKSEAVGGIASRISAYPLVRAA
jgi:hypothetical protein